MRKRPQRCSPLCKYAPCWLLLVCKHCTAGCCPLLSALASVKRGLVFPGQGGPSSGPGGEKGACPAGLVPFCVRACLLFSSLFPCLPITPLLKPDGHGGSRRRCRPATSAGEQAKSKDSARVHPPFAWGPRWGSRRRRGIFGHDARGSSVWLWTAVCCESARVGFGPGLRAGSVSRGEGGESAFLALAGRAASVPSSLGVIGGGGGRVYGTPRYVSCFVFFTREAEACVR